MAVPTDLQQLDYYRIMGVAPNATPAEIKSAYRTLAQKYHPDRNPNNAAAEEQFKLLQEAYSVLADAERRTQYDQHFRASPAPATHNDFLEEVGAGIGFLLNELFGRGNPTVRISLERALRGGQVNLRFKDGRHARLVLPPGIKSGFRICLSNTGTGVYVSFKVAPHPVFRRKGKDLYMTLAVNVLESVLGTYRQLTDPYGELVELDIPPNTMPGTRLRVLGKGVRNKHGDLVITVTNEPLSKKQRTALRKAAVQAGLLGS